MKSYKRIFAGLLAILSLGSCNDDAFLKEEPKTIYTTKTAFEKSSQVESQLVTAYRKIFSIHGYAIESLAPSPALLGGVGSDVTDIFHSLAGQGAGGWSNYAAWTTSDGKFSTVWDDFYKLISFSNLVLMGAENVEWTDETEKTYDIAQARFFRGYSYLRLAECFGGVPIVDQFTESLKLDYTRASREDVYKFAIEDLKAARKDFPPIQSRMERSPKALLTTSLPRPISDWVSRRTTPPATITRKPPMPRKRPSPSIRS